MKKATLATLIGSLLVAAVTLLGILGTSGAGAVADDRSPLSAPTGVVAA